MRWPMGLLAVLVLCLTGCAPDDMLDFRDVRTGKQLIGYTPAPKTEVYHVSQRSTTWVANYRGIWNSDCCELQLSILDFNGRPSDARYRFKQESGETRGTLRKQNLRLDRVNDHEVKIAGPVELLTQEGAVAYRVVVPEHVVQITRFSDSK